MSLLDLNFISAEMNKILVDNAKCIVKWFKKEEGYGFVNNQAIKNDIFLHGSKIDHQFLSSITPGLTISCDVISGLRGPQVDKIFSYDIVKHSISCSGSLKWFNLKRGFGFVEIDDPEAVEKELNVKLAKSDIFVSIDVLRESSIAYYKSGVKLKCDFTIDDDGNNIMQKMVEVPRYL